MVMRASTGLAVVYYGPCSVHTLFPGAGKVALDMDTDYPFEDEVTITVTPRPNRPPTVMEEPCRSPS